MSRSSSRPSNWWMMVALAPSGNSSPSSTMLRSLRMGTKASLPHGCSSTLQRATSGAAAAGGSP
eukprot:7596952-Alexandrium_andersonii.AAC.1